MIALKSHELMELLVSGKAQVKDQQNNVVVLKINDSVEISHTLSQAIKTIVDQKFRDNTLNKKFKNNGLA